MRSDQPGRQPGHDGQAVSDGLSDLSPAMSAPTDAELIEPAEVARLREEGVALIDLRSPGAYAAAHLPGAVNRPAHALIDAPAPDLGPVILYDDDGALIAERCDALRRAIGDMEFFVLRGGLKAWRAADLPLEGG